MGNRDIEVEAVSQKFALVMLYCGSELGYFRLSLKQQFVSIDNILLFK